MYRVVAKFADLTDHKHLYMPGDIFPRSGVEVSPERVKALMSAENGARMPLIERVEDEVEEIPTKQDEVPSRANKRASRASSRKTVSSKAKGGKK